MTNDSTQFNDLLKSLSVGDPAQRRAAALKLGMMHNPLVVPYLIQAAGDADVGVRTLAASGLANAGTAALPKIRKTLTNQHTSAHVRRTLLNALRHMDDPSTVADIAPLLHDPDETVCRAAAEALRAYDTPQARAALEQAD